MACVSAAACRELTGGVQAVGHGPGSAPGSRAGGRGLGHSGGSPCFLLALPWEPLSLRLCPLPLVGSQIHKMYKCKLDFIKILLILCSFCNFYFALFLIKFS